MRIWFPSMRTYFMAALWREGELIEDPTSASLENMQTAHLAHQSSGDAVSGGTASSATHGGGNGPTVESVRHIPTLMLVVGKQDVSESADELIQRLLIGIRWVTADDLIHPARWVDREHTIVKIQFTSDESLACLRDEVEDWHGPDSEWPITAYHVTCRK